MGSSVLTLLIVVTAALLAAALAFSAYTIALRARHQRRDRLWRELSGQWEPRVLSAIMDPEATSELPSAVTPEHRLHFVNFVLEYSRRVRGEERRRLRGLAEPHLDLVVERLDHPSAEIRTRAVQTLGTLGLPRYAEAVVAALDDEDDLVSMVAARALARAEFSEISGPVLSHLDRFAGWNRRFLAAMLAGMGSKIAPELRGLLRDEATQTWLRTVVAEALRVQNDPKAADAAFDVLAGDPDRELAAACLRLLGAVGRAEHLPVIRPLCRSDDAVLRAQALYAVGSLGHRDDLPLLRQSLDDPSPWVALHAARGVAEAGDVELLETIAASGNALAPVAGQVLGERATGT